MLNNARTSDGFASMTSSLLATFLTIFVTTTCVYAALDVNLASAGACFLRLVVLLWLITPASIQSAAKLVAQNLLSYYHGDQPGQIPGILPGPPPTGPYYWVRT